MKRSSISLVIAFSIIALARVSGESTVISEDDASQYSSGWDNSKNGGNVFTNWTLNSEGNDNDRHSGFFIAETKDKPDLNGIAKDDKAFGVYANGSGFEQAVGYRGFEKPLQIGDSFSLMVENGPFEKK